MTIQEIEKAVLRQFPRRKEQQLLNYTYILKDKFLDKAMVVICGLSSVYLSDPEKKVTSYFDINRKGYNTNVNLFVRSLARVSEIISSYGIDVRSPNAYRQFSDRFWHINNALCTGEIGKSGVILSHILSSKKEFSNFTKTFGVFEEGDFDAFMIYNKAKLATNYLQMNFPTLKKQEFVDIAEMAY